MRKTNRTRKRAWVNRAAGFALLACLTLMLFAGSPRGTLAYVTSAPANVVNTFAGEAESLDEPTDPDEPVNPDEPTNPDEPVNPDEPETPSEPGALDDSPNTEDSTGSGGGAESSGGAEADASSETDEASGSGLVKTGDDAPLLQCVIALVVSAAAVVFAWRRRRKKGQHVKANPPEGGKSGK